MTSVCLLISLLLYIGVHQSEGYDDLFERRSLFFSRKGGKGKHRKEKSDERADSSTIVKLLMDDIDEDVGSYVQDSHPARINDTHPPSISKFDNVDTPGRFSLISMVVENHRDVPWYVPSFHERYSAGWNRTTSLGFMLRPYACHLRFYGVGLEETMEGFQYGGSGYVSFNFVHQQSKKRYWLGYDQSELVHAEGKIFCYYMTNKHTGSEFFDKPKTLGIAIYCPVTLDQEIGTYEFKKDMIPGNICRKISDYTVQMTMTLRETNVTVEEPFDADMVIMDELAIAVT